MSHASFGNPFEGSSRPITDPIEKSYVEKEPTLIKDIMPMMESGNRTEEQLKNMPFKLFIDQNETNAKWTVASGTAQVSIGTAWASSTSFRPGQVF